MSDTELPDWNTFPEDVTETEDRGQRALAMVRYLDRARAHIVPARRESLATEALEAAIEGKNRVAQGRALMHMANSWSDRANYNHAIHLHLRAQEVLDSTDDLLMRASTRNDLATVYYRLGKLEETRQHLDSAISLSAQANDPVRGATFSLNLAIMELSVNPEGLRPETEGYVRLSELLQNAADVYRNHLATEPGNPHYPHYLAGTLHALGQLNAWDHGSALRHYKECLHVLETNGLNIRSGLYRTNLAELLAKMGDMAGAEEQYGLAEQLANESGDFNLLPNLLEKAARFHENNGHLNKALDFQKRLNEANSRIREINTNDQLDKLKAHFEAEQKAKDSEIQKLRNQILQEEKKRIEEQHHELTESIHYAKRLQEAVLPSVSALRRMFPDSFMLYLPRDIVSGDFYWVESCSPDRNPDTVVAQHSTQIDRVAEVLYFAVGDCTGHGVPGAMLSVMGLNGLNRAFLEMQSPRPKDLLTRLTKDLHDAFGHNATTVRDGMDIALCSLDPATLTLTFCGANSPLWVARGGEMLQFKPNKRPVGHFDIESEFNEEVIQLQSGDVLYLHSDGYQDQLGGPLGKKFMTRQYRELLLNISYMSMREQEENLLKVHEAWRGTGAQTDDVCVLAIRV